MRTGFAIVGVIAAGLYWRYVVFAGASLRIADLSNWLPMLAIYLCIGYALGWLLGTAFGRIGPDD